LSDFNVLYVATVWLLSAPCQSKRHSDMKFNPLVKPTTYPTTPAVCYLYVPLWSVVGQSLNIPLKKHQWKSLKIVN